MKLQVATLSTILGLSRVFAGGAALLLMSPPARAEPPWMSEEAIRTDFTAKTLQGNFRSGGRWTASYHEGGRYDVCEGSLCVEGRWYFRSRALCFLSGPPYWPLQERCAVVTKISFNCYEFHAESPHSGPSLNEGDMRPEGTWHSRGWRSSEPSTCEDRPSA